MTTKFTKTDDQLPMPDDLRLYKNMRDTSKERRDSAYESLGFEDYVELIQSVANGPNRYAGLSKKELQRRKPRDLQIVKFLNRNGEATAFVVDYDELDREGCAAVIEASKSCGHRCILHTSCSSTTDHPKLRLVFPLKYAVAEECVKAQYEALASSLGLPSGYDKTAIGVNRNWFVPNEHADTIRIEIWRGKRLVVNDVPEVSEWKLDNQMHPSNSDARTRSGKPKTSGKKQRSDDSVEQRLSMRQSSDEEDRNQHLSRLFTNIVYHLYREPAIAWIDKHLLQVGKSGPSDGATRITVQDIPKIGLRVCFECPRCRRLRSKHSEAWVQLNLVSGSSKGACWSTGCRYHKDRKGWPESGEDYSLFNLAEVVKLLVQEFDIFCLKDVNQVWWRSRSKGHHLWKLEEFARWLSTRCGSSISWREAARVLRSVAKPTVFEWGRDFPQCSNELVETAALALRELRESKSISSPRLHIVTGKSHQGLLQHYKHPVNGSYVDRLQWPLPSIQIEGKLVRWKDPQESSMAVDEVMGLGYRLLSLTKMRARLRRLPPVVVVQPKEKPDALDRRLFRQRVIACLARGCEVIVLAPSGRHAARRVAKNYGLNRDAEIGLERIYQKVWMPKGSWKLLKI